MPFRRHLGRAEAQVTLVEFFDPSCEACRALHPTVKQLLAQHPDDVRLVLRYAPFHEGSDEAVRILETARLQGVFEPVLDNLLRSQPVWAKHNAELPVTPSPSVILDGRRLQLGR